MIKSFRHKALRELWLKGSSSRIDGRFHRRLLRRLGALDDASVPDDMNISGFDFHALKGFTPTRYTVHVNGPWCLTFALVDGDAVLVDLEQYH